MTKEFIMKQEQRRGSTVTSIITAIIFFMILALFGRSVQGERIDFQAQNRSTTIATESTATCPDYYRIHILEEGKHHFRQPLNSVQ